ncbi:MULTISPECIES: ANTAR domain-containing protein [Mycobacteriaceae]|uniref:ANTAR domain-containing protein n=1 Tax=Mycobacteriaceae TaxID=1762 RepID=UPI00355C515A
MAAERPDAFDATVLANAADLAALAAGAWSAVVREEQLRRALNSRDDIGQAKGILMERFSITADGAFALLRQLSQESNTPLLDIAQHLIVTVTNGDVST